MAGLASAVRAGRLPAALRMRLGGRPIPRNRRPLPRLARSVPVCGPLVPGNL